MWVPTRLKYSAGGRCWAMGTTYTLRDPTAVMATPSVAPRRADVNWLISIVAFIDAKPPIKTRRARVCTRWQDSAHRHAVPIRTLQNLCARTQVPRIIPAAKESNPDACSGRGKRLFTFQRVEYCFTCISLGPDFGQSTPVEQRGRPGFVGPWYVESFRGCVIVERCLASIVILLRCAGRPVVCVGTPNQSVLEWIDVELSFDLETDLQRIPNHRSVLYASGRLAIGTDGKNLLESALLRFASGEARSHI